MEGGGKELGFELRAVVAASNEEERQTIRLPIIGYPGHPPEELGAVFIPWDGDRRASDKPTRLVETLPVPGRNPIEVTLISVSAAMDALGETPRAVAGGMLGGIRHNQLGEEATICARLSRQRARARSAWP